MAIGATVTVGVTMVASVTLLPALLGFVRERIEVTRWRGADRGRARRGRAARLRSRLPAAAARRAACRTGADRRLLHPRRSSASWPRRAKQPVETTLAYRWSRGRAGATVGCAHTRFGVATGVGAPGAGAAHGPSPTRATTRRRRRHAAPTTCSSEGFGPGFNGPLNRDRRGAHRRGPQLAGTPRRRAQQRAGRGPP